MIKPKLKKKHLLIAAAAVVVAAVVLWLTVFGKNGQSVEAYRKEAVSRGDIEAVVVASGTLNPVDVVEVSTQVSGRIAEIYVDFNTRVKAGQLLAKIDQSSFLTRLDQNEANYRSTQAALDKSRVMLDSMAKKYERAKSLLEKNLISFEEMENAETQFLNAEADVKSNEARLEQARSQRDSSKIDLEFTVIRSPIDGIVINRAVNVGQTVAASFQAPKLFEIANDLSRMRVECSVDEADIGRVQEGQEARFSVDAFPNDQFTGKVTQVRYSPVVAQNVVTYVSLVEVENPQLKLRPGMTATVSIVTGQATNALRVPNSALRFTPDLPPEQLAAIMQKVREEMQAKRQAEGGSPAGTGGGPGAGGMFFGGGNSGGAAPTPEMMARFRQASASGRSRQMSRVWVEVKGELRPVFVRTGVSDNTHTEIVRGELEEGQEVIVAANGGSAGRSSSGGMTGPGSMRFIMR